MPETQAGLIRGIDTIIIRVSSISNAKNWYQEKLGFASIYENEAIKLIVLDTGGATSLTIWQRDSEDSTIPSPSAYPIFKTLNAAALYDELRLKDVRVGSLDEDEHVRFFTFYDPDGNTLEACEMLDTETKP